MKYTLRKIDKKMGKNEYEMYQEIPIIETGTENDENGKPYSHFPEFLQEWIDREFAELNNKTTPQITYIMYADDLPVGEIAIRPSLNKYWSEHSGNIGYKIRPTERRKGYGTAMLNLALKECRNLGLNTVKLQCNIKNTTSQKVIENNKGQLIKKDKWSTYYKIDL